MEDRPPLAWRVKLTSRPDKPQQRVDEWESLEAKLKEASEDSTAPSFETETPSFGARVFRNGVYDEALAVKVVAPRIGHCHCGDTTHDQAVLSVRRGSTASAFFLPKSLPREGGTLT